MRIQRCETGACAGSTPPSARPPVSVSPPSCALSQHAPLRAQHATACPAQQCVLRRRLYGRRRRRRSSQRAVGRRQAGSSTGDCRSRVLAGGETDAATSFLCVLDLFACLVQEWLRNNPCPDPGIAIRARPSLSPGSSEVNRCKNSRCFAFAPGAVLSSSNLILSFAAEWLACFIARWFSASVVSALASTLVAAAIATPGRNTLFSA